MTSTVNTDAAKAPLEDLMVAMDVVDTVRHGQLIVDRALDADARRQRMLERLREIYAAQGIEVTDAALESGVDALEEERFRYEPRQTGLSARLAKLYVRRDKWGRPLFFLAAVLLFCGLGWYFMKALPEQRLRDALPAEINATYNSIISQATGAQAKQLAEEYLGKARRAMANDKYAQAKRVHADLLNLKGRLEQAYDIRIIARPNQLSGVWRVPAVNSEARNYYLIVEAVTASGQTIAVPIASEEDRKTKAVTTWGVRVSESAFEAVAADKRDDGIIQSDVIGTKPVGKIQPDYLIETTGATITEW